MDKDTQHQQALKGKFCGMAQEIRQKAQAEAELLPPALLRLDQLQTQVHALQIAQQQMQQQMLQQAQQLEDQRALILRVGQIVARTEKRLIQQPRKKSWMPWIS